MKVRTGGFGSFQCEDCGCDFAARVVPGQELYCPNCGKLDTVPEEIELATDISFIKNNETKNPWKVE